MNTRHRWSIHADVAATVDLLLRGQSSRPQLRELDSDGSVRLVDAEPSRSPSSRARPALAVVPLPDPKAPSARVASPAEESAALVERSNQALLQVLCCGITPQLVDQAIRRHGWPARWVDDLHEADVVLSIRQGLGQQPALRRQARDSRVPILVIKSDTLPQVERALERLLTRRASSPQDPPLTSESQAGDREDALAALEECRLAVEKVVLPLGRPVELLPRSEQVRQMQVDLVTRYRLRSDVFGQADQQRLRVYPP